MNDTAPTAAITTVQNWYQAEADTLYALAAAGGLTFPGALCGALVTGALWHGTSAPASRRAILAVSGCLAVVVMMHGISLGWFWRLVDAAVTRAPSPVSPEAVVRSAAAEVLLGPLLLLTLQCAQACRIRTALGQVAHEHRRMNKRAKALQFGYQEAGDRAAASGDWAHPQGKIRLGLDETRHVFDLDVRELQEHIFVPGASGYGKTTTLIRLAGGALSNGYGAIIIDCKGVGLAPDARGLAGRFRIPFNMVDPDERKSLGYDPCTGDPAHIANKLVGAFSFSGDAEIYKQVAMEVVPVIARALGLAGEPVTLRRIYDALGKGGLARLGRTPGVESMRDRLDGLEQGGGVGAAGYVGLQRRLGALLEGKFGELFEKKPALDWGAVTRKPSVTYFSLSATATSEDVELFARVITQDLKQLCDARLRLLRSGKPVTPVLLIYDEFAALREPRQIVDLLLQARQAKMPVVVGTQFLPEEASIRTPLLQAGTLICHRVGSEDAEAVAAEIGTRDTPKITSQLDWETGQSEKGSLRMTKEYHVHPDTLKELHIGMTAVYARRSQRRQLVQIHLEQP